MFFSLISLNVYYMHLILLGLKVALQPTSESMQHVTCLTYNDDNLTTKVNSATQ